MNSYDGSRISEMDTILNYMYKMSFKRFLAHKDVYNVLCYYGLKPNDRPKDMYGREVFDGVSNEEMFKYWENRFQGKRNINAFVDPNWSYFFQFTNKISHSTKQFIKLYIPLDRDHLYDGANILFDFLQRNDLVHLSKISKKLRVDNVIVRLKADDYETARKIIDFINKTPYLKNGLNKPNPFIPTINGIGYMMEHGNSYNSDLSHYIKEYINRCRKNNLPTVSASGFRDFLIECKKNNIGYSEDYVGFDDSLLKTFEIAYTGQNKDLNRENESRLSDDQKRALLISAIKATYQKYDISQVKMALAQIIDFDNFSYITNGGNNKFRERLKENLTSSDVLKIVDSINNAKSDMKLLKTYDKVNAFCMELFKSELPFLLDEICSVTLENHDAYQVRVALEEFMRTGSTSYFSRYKKGNGEVNYREKLRLFDRRDFIRVLMACLSNKGIDPNNIGVQNMCEVYASALGRERTI